MLYRKRKRARYGWCRIVRRKLTHLARTWGGLSLIILLLVSCSTSTNVDYPLIFQKPTVSSFPGQIFPITSDDQFERTDRLVGSWQIATIHVSSRDPVQVGCFPHPRLLPDNDDTTLVQVLTIRQDRSPPLLTSEPFVL